MQKRKAQIFILSLLFLIGMGEKSCAQSIDAKFDVIDLGEVYYEQPVTALFELKNRGSEFFLKDVKPFCGCTRVDFPKKEIAKGENFTVSVTYDARQLGHFIKDVAIVSDQFEKPVYLTVKGVVVPEPEDYYQMPELENVVGLLKLDRVNVEFNDASHGDVLTEKINFINTAPRSVEPKIVHLPAYMKAQVVPEIVGPNKTGAIIFTLNSALLRNYGLTQASVYLLMYPGEKVAKENEMLLSAVKIPSFENMSESQRLNAPKLEISATELDLGEFKKKTTLKGEITITNRGRTHLDISSLQMFTEGMNVSLNKTVIAPGDNAKLKIVAFKKHIKNVRSVPRVLMITNDPQHPKVIVSVKVK